MGPAAEREAKANSSDLMQNSRETSSEVFNRAGLQFGILTVRGPE
jgi:hypothetical protein